MCNCELREGKQHCQKGTPEFLEETICAAKKMTNKTLLIRMDSGNDALDNMALLHWSDSKIKFLIKRNFRREDKLATAEELKKVCKNITKPCDGKTVYAGSTYREFHDVKIGNFTVRAVYEITERITDADGQEFIEPDNEINMILSILLDAILAKDFDKFCDLCPNIHGAKAEWIFGRADYAAVLNDA